MKRTFFILILTLISRAPAFSQGTMEFNINFGGNPPPHAATVPNSGALLTGSEFAAAIYLDNTAPTAGRIVQMGSGGSLSTVFDFPSPVYASYGAPYSGTAFSYDHAWQLTDPQIQSLLAGQWYADITYGTTDYIGQITVAPEPSSSALALSAAGLLATAALFRRRFQALRHVSR